MTNKRIEILAVSLLLSIAACAISRSRSRSEEDSGKKDSGEESMREGDARSDVDLPSNSIPSSGSDDPDEPVEAEDSGTEETQPSSWMDSGIDVSIPSDSIASQPDVGPVSEDNREVKEAPLDLISQYCHLLEEFPCLNPNFYDLIDSEEERIRYCEQELENDYYRFVSASRRSLCESKWKAVLQCGVEYDYSCPCSGQECYLGSPVRVSFSLSPCEEVYNALQECAAEPFQLFSVTGERLRCDGYLNGSEHVCTVMCPDNGSVDLPIRLECDGPSEGPLQCTCTYDERPLYDAYGFPYDQAKPPILMPDCESATQAMADGLCHRITDCCFTWENEDEGIEDEACCGCTADPTQSSTGATTCEELASSLGGEVVDICPYYEDYIPQPGEPP